jgi:hypothetical protein
VCSYRRGLATIYFEGPIDFRPWHCGYSNGDLHDLTFDW